MSADPATGVPAERYAGPATVSIGPEGGGPAAAVEVEVRLRGQFEPLDGTYHWYGRIATCAALDEQVQPGATVTLRTPHGEARGRLSDVDPWGRFRISGTGRPPY